MTRFLDKRGESAPLTAFIFLSIMLILSVALFFAAVEIEAMGIVSAVKAELANLAVSISAETYDAIRETSFGDYEARLAGERSRAALVAMFKSNLEEAMPFETDSYTISGIELAFTDLGNDILKYEFSCTTEFRVTALGGGFAPVVKHISIDGRHVSKTGRV